MPRARWPALIVALLLLAGPVHSVAAEDRYAPVRTESGWTQGWFVRGDLDLPVALARASAAGRRLAVLFEQRGCRYCAELHTDHLTRREIADYIRARFAVLQMDVHGTRPVTDFDGQRLEERGLARKWCVIVTPTIVFLPERAPPARADGPRRCGMDIEVARMQGLLPRPEFLGLFAYVAERGYADGTSFPAWRASRAAVPR
jgi:thioredoxin-related protein